MRRVLKLLAVAILLPGGLAIVAVTLAVNAALAKVRAADPKWAPAYRVLAWARFWSWRYKVPFDFMLSILHNEGASTARAPRATELPFFVDDPRLVYPLGDTGISKGPSVGPGQVLRINVEKLWTDAPAALRPFIVAPSVVYLALPGYERQALYAAVQIARQSIDAAGGDLTEAARIYNGGPHYNSDAITYADRADTFREAIS